MSTIERVSRNMAFGGYQDIYDHKSSSLSCDMRFGVFLPPQAEHGECPVLYWLSGLTCTEQNFVTKAGAQRYAAEHGLIVIVPDTSPRGDHVPDDEAYDLGQGAGFYLNATREPWAKHFRMYDYVVSELPELVRNHFPVTDRAGICGHSMGGHGALTIALKNPGSYRSVSAFAPIASPSRVPWGQKAFRAYLGDDQEAWAAHDATELVANAKERLLLLIDQGDSDPFLETELQPGIFLEACNVADHPIELRLRAGYDHSYYTIATFIADHIAHHAQALL